MGEALGTGAGDGPRRVDLRLSALVVGALVLRLVWVMQLPEDAAYLQRLPDQVQYLELAGNLLDGRGLVFIDPRFNEEVRAFRMPGYPVFVAGCLGRVDVVRVVQALLDAGTVLGAYILARRWLGRGESLLAAGIVAINPYLIYFCGLVLSETLFTAMLVWGMALLVVRQPSDARMRGVHGLGRVVGAVILVLSILVRPSAMWMPLVLGIVGAFVNRDSPQPYDRRWVPPVASTMLLLTLVVLFPWAWRNSKVVKQWLWTTTNDGFTLYDGLNPDATGASDQTFVRELSQLRSMGEVERSKYLTELAWEYARSHPVEVARLAGVKIGRTWSPIPLSSEYGRDWKLVAVGLGYMVPLYVLILAGLWGGGLSKSAKLFLLTPAVYLTIVHAVSVGSLRYRVPSDVPIAVVAATGVAARFSKPKASQSRAQEPHDSRSSV